MERDEQRRRRSRRDRRRKPLIRYWPGVFLVWAALVILAYYRVHKPIGWPQAEAIAYQFLVISAWLGTISLAHGLGRVFIDAESVDRQRTRFTLRIGLGLGLIGFGVLALGVLRLYHPLLCWSLLLVGQFFSLPMFIKEARQSLPAFPQQALDRFYVITVVLLAGSAFLQALTPPTAYDSLVYHLTGPKLYLQAQALHHNIDLPYLGFPQAGEMLFLWGLVLIGPQTAKLLHFSFMLLSLGLIWEHTSRLAPGRSLFAIVLLLATPSALQLAGWAYVDWIPMFSGLAALSVMEAFWANRDQAKARGRDSMHGSKQDLLHVAVVAFFAALAFNAKYSAVGLSVGILLAFLLQTRSLRWTTIASGLFLGLISPYLIKNALLTRNPTYPFFFDGVYWDPLRAAWYSRFGTGLSLFQVLRAPWDMTVGGVEGGVVQGYPAFGATIGPLLLAFAPFIALALTRARDEAGESVLRIGVIALMGAFFWTGQIASSALLVQARLLFPVLPLVVLLMARGFDRFTSLGDIAQSVSVILTGLMVFILVLTAFSQLLSLVRGSTLPYLLGLISEDRYLKNELGQYFLAVEKINKLPLGARVQFLWEGRSYHCAEHVHCQPDAILDRWWHARRTIGEPADIASSWKSEGVTHVLIAHPRMDAVREAGSDPIHEADWGALEVFVEAHLKPLGSEADLFALYELHTRGVDTHDSRADGKLASMMGW